MPIENERKFVLENDGRLEPLLGQAPGVVRSILVQAYLDAPGLRLRGIETEIHRVDFHRLWTLRRETLQKVRYSWPEGDRYKWDVDFFKGADGATYFVLAEVEMPEHETNAPPLPPRLAPHLLAAVPYGDPRFSSKRLADQPHAERLLVEVRMKGSAA